MHTKEKLTIIITPVAQSESNQVNGNCSSILGDEDKHKEKDSETTLMPKFANHKKLRIRGGIMSMKYEMS